MEPASTYGKMDKQQLLNELGEVSGMLAGKMRELGALQADFNNEWYPIYWRTPGNSVAAKEKEANYQCISIINDMGLLEADIQWLTALRDCLVVMVNAG